MKRLLSLASLMVAIVLPFLSVQACGPEFFPDVFIHSLHPDHPADYAKGNLGVLLATYPRAELIVAYRYLNDGALTPEERRGYKPTRSLAEQEGIDSAADNEPAVSGVNGAHPATEPPGAADFWLQARGGYASPLPKPEQSRQYGMQQSDGTVFAGEYQNCQADAFRTAAATLDSRVKTWGAHSPALADWIKGQDAVFSNCGAKSAFVPAAAPGDAPVLLRQDRAYQIAAAQFYSAQFGPARASFEAIAHDSDSPWRGVSSYLVARALVRDSYLNSTSVSDDPMASFKADLMTQAQQQLESIRGANLPGVSAHAIQNLLDLVRLRTEPQARLLELSDALAGPKTDPDFAQNLDDITWYLNAKLDGHPLREDTEDFSFDVKKGNEYHPLTFEQKLPGFEEAFGEFSDLRSTSPLIDWLITFQSPSDSASKHAIAEWRRTGQIWWLTAAIAKASANDPDASALIDAAGRVRSASPAWLTVTYHRERLLIDTGHSSQAGIETEAIMPVILKSGNESAVNLFTGLHMRTATKLDDALADAPRKILGRSSEEQASLDECFNIMQDPKRKYDCQKDASPVEFSADAASIFNLETPLATLAQAAHSTALPPHLRQSVAILAWVRAVLLNDESVAAQMLPLLPEKIQLQAAPGHGFHPLMTLLRNPGLRPYLDPGVQRSESYDFVESFNDNWWCSDWNTPFTRAHDPQTAQSAAFLSSQYRASGEKELAALRAQGSAEENLGSQVIVWANAHPSDPDVPEALFLTLRMIRYGCYHGWASDSEKDAKDQVASIALEIGAIMRRRYATDPWTKKAAPYVWPVEKSG